VAYLVMTKDATAKGAQPKPIELRKFLGEHLPDYMVPASFVQLPELPLSVNGKLDRGALPQPTAANTMPEDFFEEPQSPIEERLAALLSPLLGTRVGREDNIFNLGGHSLMGAQIIAKIRQTFGVDLSLRSVFDRPTVRELSAEIERLVHAKLDAMTEDEAQQILASASLEAQW
jgi:acyl carrier protein